VSIAFTTAGVPGADDSPDADDDGEPGGVGDIDLDADTDPAVFAPDS
jgi:hypothetical protein